MVVLLSSCINRTDWTPVVVYERHGKIIARISNRVLIGLPLCIIAWNLWLTTMQVATMAISMLLYHTPKPLGRQLLSFLFFQASLSGIFNRTCI